MDIIHVDPGHREEASVLIQRSRPIQYHRDLGGGDYLVTSFILLELDMNKIPYSVTEKDAEVYMGSGRKAGINGSGGDNGRNGSWKNYLLSVFS